MIEIAANAAKAIVFRFFFMITSFRFVQQNCETKIRYATKHLFFFCGCLFIFVLFFFVSLKSLFSFLKSLFSRLKSLFRIPKFVIRKRQDGRRCKRRYTASGISVILRWPAKIYSDGKVSIAQSLSTRITVLPDKDCNPPWQGLQSSIGRTGIIVSKD